MTTRAERIEKARGAVIEASKELEERPGRTRNVTDLFVAVEALRKAEASGPPDIPGGMHPDDFAVKVLRALADAPGFCVSLALEWAEELEER